MAKTARDYSATWGKWSGKRELVRGLLHFSVGLVGWVLVHLIQLDADLITFLLCLVSFVFIVLDGVRLAINRWHNTDCFTRFLQWIDNRLVKKFFTRETENHQQTTTVASVLGLSTAWIIGPRWICAAVILYFGLIDPLAKLGKYWPIVVFERGWAKDKSLGGVLFGLAGGGIGLVTVLLVNYWVQIIPLELTLWQALVVFLVGLFSASLSELIGRKADNFLIPVSSAIAMVVVYNQFFS
ncbi:MAG: hypothetical protein NTU97_01450 [Candidatus Magasanikbacteria bacterium]|nr:hypothetical protein [Candidatus Magasanikbacteria bacterium]